MTQATAAVFDELDDAKPLGSRGDRLQCGFTVLEIEQAFTFTTRKGASALIVEGSVIASSAHARRKTPTPAHPAGSKVSIYLAVTGREPKIVARDLKSLIIAAMGIDLGTADGRKKVEEWDSAGKWSKLAPLLFPSEVELRESSQIVGMAMGVWVRPKYAEGKAGDGKWFTNMFFEHWTPAREERDGLPVFDPANPPESPPLGALEGDEQ
jgi:hypothetical protein